MRNLCLLRCEGVWIQLYPPLIIPSPFFNREGWAMLFFRHFITKKISVWKPLSSASSVTFCLPWHHTDWSAQLSHDRAANTDTLCMRSCFDLFSALRNNQRTFVIPQVTSFDCPDVKKLDQIYTSTEEPTIGKDNMFGQHRKQSWLKSERLPWFWQSSTWKCLEAQGHGTTPKNTWKGLGSNHTAPIHM